MTYTIREGLELNVYRVRAGRYDVVMCHEFAPRHSEQLTLGIIEKGLTWWISKPMVSGASQGRHALLERAAKSFSPLAEHWAAEFERRRAAIDAATT